jgi:uncharacterized membrane protein YfcA
LVARRRACGEGPAHGWRAANLFAGSGARRQKRAMQFLIVGVIGLVSGITSGLFGVGGGIVMVPAMMFFMRDQIGENIKVAIGTSLAVIIPTALMGSFKHYQQGNINWQVVLALVPLAVVGGFLGAKLTSVLHAEQLRRAFGGFMILVGVRILFFK